MHFAVTSILCKDYSKRVIPNRVLLISAKTEVYLYLDDSEIGTYSFKKEYASWLRTLVIQNLLIWVYNLVVILRYLVWGRTIVSPSTFKKISIQACSSVLEWKIWSIFAIHISLIVWAKFIYIIIIFSRYLHGYPWPSLATPPYRSSLPVGSQGYTPCHHRAAVCRFERAAQLLHCHVKGSIGVHHLWARPYFSSSVLHVWFV